MRFRHYPSCHPPCHRPGPGYPAQRMYRDAVEEGRPAEDPGFDTLCRAVSLHDPGLRARHTVRGG